MSVVRDSKHWISRATQAKQPSPGIQRTLRHLGIGFVVFWLALCIVVPSMLLSPADTTEAIVALPIAPVRSSSDAIQTMPRIVGYHGYITTEDDNLQSIAHRGGSDASLIRSYNRLHGTLQPHQPLIVPHIIGTENTLETTPLLVVQGQPDQPRVALTLDAGAGSEPVPDILATLRERDIQITFFLTGAWVERNPELARQIVEDGHEIANHSFSHPDFTRLSDAEVIEEIATTEQIVQQVTGASTRPYFRPPFGAYNSTVLRLVINQGYLPIYWTLDSLDSVGEPKTPEFILERVTNTLPPHEMHGMIILAHCGSQATADALPALLDRFTELELEVSTLSETLGR